MVEWGCFITDDSLGYVEAAQAAADRLEHPENQAWVVTDLETGQAKAVDLITGKILDSRRGSKVA